MNTISTKIVALGIFFSFSAIGLSETVRHGDLQIVLPSRPSSSTERIRSAKSDRGVLQHRLTIDSAQGAIIIWHQEAGNTDPNETLEVLRDQLLRTAGGNAVVDEAVQLEVHPGRTILVTIPNRGFFRVTYFYVNGKYYQIMAAGTRAFVGSVSVQQMFSSVSFAKS